MARRRRAYNPNSPAIATKVYPTPFALKKRGLEPQPNNNLATAASEQSKATSCWQCGSHIEDPAAYSTCPFCSSDNFDGHAGP